jgi:glutamine phosphoribosylpyrophosphate amidotransferase
MDGNIAAQRVMNKLHATEASIDKAIEDAAALMTELLAAQQAVNASPLVTDAAFAKITAALGALQGARSAVLGSHRRLEKVRDELGLRTVAFGVIKPQFAQIEADDVTAEAQSAVA